MELAQATAQGIREAGASEAEANMVMFSAMRPVALNVVQGDYLGQRSSDQNRCYGGPLCTLLPSSAWLQQTTEWQDLRWKKAIFLVEEWSTIVALVHKKRATLQRYLLPAHHNITCLPKNTKHIIKFYSPPVLFESPPRPSNACPKIPTSTKAQAESLVLCGPPQLMWPTSKPRRRGAGGGCCCWVSRSANFIPALLRN